MSVKLTVDRITPDIKYDDKGNITWTPRLVDYNVAQYPAGHVVTSNEFNTEFLKMVYQGNYLTDTITVLTTLYNSLQSNVKQTAESAASDATIALTKAITAENNSVTAINTASSALDIIEDAAADAQAAVNAATNAVTTAENAINTAETAKATAEDASDKADEAYLKAGEAITTAESADSIAVTAQTESTEAKQIASAANTTADAASTKAANAVDTANAAKQIADASAATVASKVSQEYVDNKFTDYYNKSTIDSLLDNVTVDLSAYYTSDQVNALIPNEYIKSVSVTEDTLNLTKQDDTTITFQGGKEPLVFISTYSSGTKPAVGSLIGRASTNFNRTPEIGEYFQMNYDYITNDNDRYSYNCLMYVENVVTGDVVGVASKIISLQEYGNVTVLRRWS